MNKRVNTLYNILWCLSAFCYGYLIPPHNLIQIIPWLLGVITLYIILVTIKNKIINGKKP